MTQPYRGEMFMGDPVTEVIDSVYLQYMVGSTLLPFVPGTAIVFTGDIDPEDGFIPDGRCWPADEEVPGAGLISNGILALSGATAVRIYARVSCNDWQSE